jgi:hypothetical protein
VNDSSFEAEPLASPSSYAKTVIEQCPSDLQKLFLWTPAKPTPVCRFIYDSAQVVLDSFWLS